MNLARADRREVARAALSRWQHDPVAFCREVLGLTPWRRQADILNAVGRHARVAVRSGHKCGKSTSVAALALWFVCTRPRARVIFTAASARQVRSILWKEIRRLHREALRPIGGDLHENPETGLTFRDGREVLGFSTDDPERFAGFSGPNMLFVVDEASGVGEPIFAALEGNRAGGAKVCLISNPTQVTGTFYDAFHSSAEFWHGIHISSAEAASEGRIPGLATQEWIDEKRREYGVDSPFYQVRVEGNFPAQSTDSVIPLSVVEAAHRRFNDTTPEGRLELGVDVARYGGDDTVIVWRRGNYASAPIVLTGFSVTAVTGKVLEVVHAQRRDGERPVVKVDSAQMGAGVVDLLEQRSELQVHPISSSSASSADGYSRKRDQLWFGLRDWLIGGGAIPKDSKLDADLLAPKYGFDVSGRIKVESKEEMRKRLGRSTDRADALALAVHHVDDDAWDASLAFSLSDRT